MSMDGFSKIVSFETWTKHRDERQLEVILFRDDDEIQQQRAHVSGRWPFASINISWKLKSLLSTQRRSLNSLSRDVWHNMRILLLTPSYAFVSRISLWHDLFDTTHSGGTEMCSEKSNPAFRTIDNLYALCCWCMCGVLWDRTRENDVPFTSSVTDYDSFLYLISHFSSYLSSVFIHISCKKDQDSISINVSVDLSREKKKHIKTFCQFPFSSDYAPLQQCVTWLMMSRNISVTMSCHKRLFQSILTSCVLFI